MKGMGFSYRKISGTPKVRHMRKGQAYTKSDGIHSEKCRTLRCPLKPPDEQERWVVWQGTSGTIKS